MSFYGTAGKLTHMTEEEEEILKPMFDYFDTDRDQKLTAKQARALWAGLGYPPEKSDFKGRAITFEDIVYQINTKRTQGVLGKDDLEGRARRAFRMMNPSVADVRSSMERFTDFVHTLGVKPSGVILKQIYEIMCAQGYGVRIDDDDESSQGSITSSLLTEEEGFTEEDFVNFILDEYARSKRPMVFE